MIGRQRELDRLREELITVPSAVASSLFGSFVYLVCSQRSMTRSSLWPLEDGVVGVSVLASPALPAPKTSGEPTMETWKN